MNARSLIAGLLLGAALSVAADYRFVGSDPVLAVTATFGTIANGACIDRTAPWPLAGFAGAPCLVGASALFTNPGVQVTCGINTAGDTAYLRACNNSGASITAGALTFNVRVFQP